MITPADILRRGLRHYFEWLENLVCQEAEFIPLIIKYTGDTRTVDADRLKSLNDLVDHSKEKIDYGYRIVLDIPNQRSINKQSRIKSIVFDTSEDLIRFIDRQEEFMEFQQSLALIRNEASHLQDWCVKNVREISRYTKQWPALLAIVNFFRANPTPGLPLRLLPIMGVDTKFIEQHNSILCGIMDASLSAEYIDYNFRLFAKRYRLPTQEPFVECYFNDPVLAQHFHGFTTVALPADELSGRPLPVNAVIIVENRTSVQQLLKQPLPATAVIFGCGYGVALLKNASWLHKIQLYYWGDLDTHGLAILSQVRSYFPQVQPLMMNAEILAAHQHLVVPGKPFRGELPENLTIDEKYLFQLLQDRNQRLEQERVLQNVLQANLPL